MEKKNTDPFVGYRNISYICIEIKKKDMPTVLDLFGLKFLIFTHDHQPPHCHVKSVNGAAKFKITDKVELIESTLRPKEQKLAEYVIAQSGKSITEKFDSIKRF